MSRLYQKIIFLSIITVLLMLWNVSISIVFLLAYVATLMFILYQEDKRLQQEMTKYRLRKNSQLKEVKVQKAFSQDILESVIKSMHLPMLFIDKEGYVGFSNDSFTEAFFLSDIVDEKYDTVLKGQLLNIVEQSYTWERKMSTLATIDEQYYQVETTPLFNDTIFNGALILFTDISKVKAVKRMQKQFLSDISHELKTPMSVIISSAEMLKQKGMKDTETFDEFLSILLKESYRMQDIVNDMLELSHLEQPKVKLEPMLIDLETLLKETVNTFESMAKEKYITIIYQNHIKDGIVLDYNSIKTIITNLVSNAIKYSHEGVITISTKVKDSTFILKVQDEGIGIAQEHIPFVFDRFYRVQRYQKKNTGTGLGLSIVKKMIELNGGDIELESELNIGSTCIVSIPIQ